MSKHVTDFYEDDEDPNEVARMFDEALDKGVTVHPLVPVPGPTITWKPTTYTLGRTYCWTWTTNGPVLNA